MPKPRGRGIKGGGGVCYFEKLLNLIINAIHLKNKISSRLFINRTLYSYFDFKFEISISEIILQSHFN